MVKSICGSRADGTWFYLGTPIGRPALVRLFASILRKDPERFVLVTPVEMVGIMVDDAPFLAVAMDKEVSDAGARLTFRTDVDDHVAVGPDLPTCFEEDVKGGLKPYIRVRGDLRATVSRPVLFDLVAFGEERDVECQLTGCEVQA